MNYDDILQKINAGDYETKRAYTLGRDAAAVESLKLYHEERNKKTADFMEDLKSFLSYNNVPLKYVDKVASKAWSDGHSSGYHEVLIHASDLTDIFS